MTDDNNSDDAPDQSLRERRQAQSTADDLARMGIDPTSLGLGVPERTPRPVAEPDPDDTEPRAAVVPLRPEFASMPVAPVEAPAQPYVPSDVETALSKVTEPPPVSRQATRFLRTVARGLSTPDAAVAIQSERDAVDAVRHRQTDRRIVAFLAGKGGVGCTTVAVGVGTAFMAMRDDHSVVVDVQRGSASLGRIFGAAEPRTVASLLGEVEAATPPVAETGLGLVDGSGWDQGLTRNDVAGVLDRLRPTHTFNLLDVGDDAGEAAHAALARADQAVIVTGPGALGLEALSGAMERMRAVNPMAAARVISVVVCPHEHSYRDAHREAVDALRIAAEAVVVIPPDSFLQDGRPYDPAGVTGATREALLRIAGLIAIGGKSS